MTVGIGSKLGPYDILGAIGAGGMGQVYRARDTRLDRDVAVKVLPAGFAIDPDRRARFEREAKAVAAITHPNIVSLFDTGTHAVDAGPPVPYVVMELLDGETLRERLTATGAIPIRKGVDITIQIARGLSAAHDRQLVHRDLKPENVFLTRDGQVKILDFGIAKALLSDANSGGATQTAAAGTDPGSVIGTAGYMAPEQVRGQAVDARTDLFALGALLFEMIAGQRAFAGDTAAETMTAILREDPPDTLAKRPDMPPALDRILRHCLEKNPSERFQTARDVAFALEALSGSGTAPAIAITSSTPARRSISSWVLAAGAIALVAASVFAAKFLWATPPSTEWTGIALGGPAFASNPKLSPDGRTLAFIAMVGRNTQVAVMTPESGDWAVRTANRSSRGYVTDIDWSPQGDLIYYGLNSDVPRGIFSVPSVGGPEKQVLADAYQPLALPDGTLVVTRFDSTNQPRLCRFWPDSGQVKELPIVVPRFSQATHVLRDGRSIVTFGTLTTGPASAGLHLYLVDLESGAARRLASDAEENGLTASTAVGVAPDGRSIIVSGQAGHLTRIARMAIDGVGRAETLFTVTSRVWSIDVGRDNTVYLDEKNGPLRFWRFGLSGGRGELAVSVENTASNFNYALAVLGDGRLLLSGFPGGHRRLLITEPGRDPRALISAEESSSPLTVIGGDTVVYLAGGANDSHIATASIATGRVTGRINFDKGPVDSMSASPDGKTLYVGWGGTIWAVPVAGGAPRSIRAGSSAAVTPDGRRLLVQVLGTPTTTLFEVPLDGGAEREIVPKGPYTLTFDPIVPGAISRDGRQLLVSLASLDDWYFLPGVLDLTTGATRVIPVDEFCDFHIILWGPGDKSIIAGGAPTSYAMWRFQPEK